jgi:hypothetical protein
MQRCPFWVRNGTRPTGRSDRGAQLADGQESAINKPAAYPDFWDGRGETPWFKPMPVVRLDVNFTRPPRCEL